MDCALAPSTRFAAAAPSARPAPVVAASSPRPAPAPATRPGQTLAGDELARFEALRDWRRHVAAGKPAYTVFSDATLQALSVANPSSIDQLARIKGVGPAKLEQYGESVLRLLADLAG